MSFLTFCHGAEKPLCILNPPSAVRRSVTIQGIKWSSPGSLFPGYCRFARRGKLTELVASVALGCKCESGRNINGSGLDCPWGWLGPLKIVYGDETVITVDTRVRLLLLWSKYGVCRGYIPAHCTARNLTKRVNERWQIIVHNRGRKKKRKKVISVSCPSRVSPNSNYVRPFFS